MRKTPTFATFPQFLYNMGVTVSRVKGKIVFSCAGDNAPLSIVTIYNMAKDYQAFQLVFDTLHSRYDKLDYYTEEIMLELYADVFGLNFNEFEGFTAGTKDGLPVFRDSAGAIHHCWFVRDGQKKFLKRGKPVRLYTRSPSSKKSYVGSDFAKMRKCNHAYYP